MKTKALTTKTLSDVARLFGVSGNTAKEWKNVRGMPVEPDGSFDLVAIHAWWRDRQAPKEKPAETTKIDLEKRKLSVECERRELALEEARGKLVNRDLMKAAVREMFHRVRARLQAAPEELGSGLPAEIRPGYIEEAKHRVRLILQELNSWAPPSKDTQ
ncbi:MAG: hypothetical protein ACYC4U_10270 [Pirellulaceae bacterium]